MKMPLNTNLDSSNKCNGRKKEVKILKKTARRKENPFLLC
jgi:hypothetical protein